MLDDVVEATITRNNLNTIADNSIGKRLVSPTEISSSPHLVGYAAIAGLALPSIAYYQRTGTDPIYALANAVASASDAIFVPAYQAFKANFVSPETYPASAAQYVGVEGSVGAMISDFVDFVKSDQGATYPELNQLVADNSTSDGLYPGPGMSNFPSGTVVTLTNGQNILVGAIDYASWADPVNMQNQINSSPTKFYFQPSGGCRWNTVNRIYCITNEPRPNSFMVAYYEAPAWATTSQSTISPTAGQLDYSALQQALNNPSPTQKEEITEAIKNIPTEKKIASTDPAPTSFPAQQPAPITENQIQNFFTSNTTNIYNEYLTNIQNGTATASDQVAADLAKAQEEEVAKLQEQPTEEEEQEEETFDGINISAFEPPYDPGPFDIPGRFQTFLNNVKSSGLFSFSSNFFESLPSGGDPVFEINGGETFGTHTIDLSETFTGGLAVVKTVLLALFGFLSIRAIILKR